MPDFHTLGWPHLTSRLSIRPAIDADGSATWPIRSHPDVAYWMTSSHPSLAAHIEHFRAPDRLAKTLVVELDDRIIGDLMLAVGDAWAQTDVADQAGGVQAELGWSFDPAYAGRGYATEAVQELIKICFLELGLRRLTAECFVDNTRSWRLMERVGMRRESYTVKDALHRSLGWADSTTYALLAEEWTQAKRAE